MILRHKISRQTVLKHFIILFFTRGESRIFENGKVDPSPKQIITCIYYYDMPMLANVFFALDLFSSPALERECKSFFGLLLCFGKEW